jgi:membrane-bound lytic murein transglycosylase B
VRALAALLLLAVGTGAAAAESFGERPDVKSLIGELVERHGFDAAKLERVFARTQRLDAPLQLIVPAERPPWQDYRAQFVNDTRVARGAAFWKVNRKILARAERKYGVSAAIIVAILGVETNYGRHMGRYRVVDALATLAFDYTPRASYFRSELEQYLLLARESRVDVFSLQGSYAGAIGIPQFMPGSVRRYAVDFDGDGAIDLRRSSADAIGSVANFLREHGWKTGEPVLLRSAYHNAFKRARAEPSIRTIAFPAISTGVYGYPKRAATMIAIEVMLAHREFFDCIVACVYSESDAIIYRQVVAEIA